MEFVCVKKNESMTPTCNVSLLTTAFEMLSKYNMSSSQNRYKKKKKKKFISTSISVS